MKAAILGCGRMGQRHIEVAQSLGLSIAGVFDRFPASVQQAQAKFQLPDSACHTTIDSLWATRPEVVIVSTTAPSHAEFTIDAAAHGARFILTEKPLATSLADCDRILRACQDHGAKLAVNHQMRFMEQYTRPKALLQSRDFGGLVSILAGTGNFGLAMNGTHYVEMFRTMTDEPVATVSAWFSDEIVPNPRGPEFLDRAGCLRLTTETGKRFYLDCSADQGHGLVMNYFARNGHITVDELRGRMTTVCRKPEHRDLPTTRYGMPWDEAEEKITPADSTSPTRAVLEALLNGGDYPDGLVGRHAVAVLVAAHLSAEQNSRTVPIAEAEMHATRLFPWA